MPTQAPPKPTAKPVTKEWRKWEGVNVRDARTGIGETEFAWLENAITIGAGAIQILPGPGPTVATLTQGIATMKGFRLNGLPVIIAVGRDGSLTQVTPFGSVTVIAPPGTVSVNAELTIWQGSPILIIDPIFGYSSWDGTTYTVLDATQTGEHLAVFQGRVWISKGRAITYTAPNSFSNFNPGDGGGSTNITDEAFEGNIFALVSALEQLWIVGDSAIEALSNVTAFGAPPNVFTSFSISNVVSSVGSQYAASVIGYFRALVFASPFGVYALSGVTPQKISEKLDDFPFTPPLGVVANVPAAVAVVQNTLAVLFLVTYGGTLARAGAGPIPLVAGFVQGKWFFAAQGDLTWITTVTVNGVAQAWGTDGTAIYQLFGADLCTAVSYKIMSKLYDHGSAVTEKALTKLGIELRTQPVSVGVELSCITNNPVLAGTVWNRDTTVRSNGTFPAASVFYDDLTVYAFHVPITGGAFPMAYDLSVNGGVTWPTTRATLTVVAGDVVGARYIASLGRFILLLNASQGIAYSDNVITLPLASTWTSVTPPGSVGAPVGFEVNGQNVVYCGQDGGGNIQLAFSTDGGATFLASTTMPADTITTPFGYQIFASPSPGIWCFLNPKSGKIYRSTDSGNNWSAAVTTITAGNVALSAVACILAVTATRLVAVYKGQVVVSTDAGLTWVAKQNLTLVASSPASIQQASIAALGNYGLPAGQEQLGGLSTFLSTFAAGVTAQAGWRSTDRGENWTIVNVVGGANHGSASVAMTALAARQGRGVADLWNLGAAQRDSWSSSAIATTPVCMTLINNAGLPLTIALGLGESTCDAQPFVVELTADSEVQSVAIPVYGTAGIQYILNNVGRLMLLVNNVGVPLVIMTTGLVLAKLGTALYGHYLGWTVQGTSPPYRIETMEMEYAPTREWDLSP